MNITLTRRAIRAIPRTAHASRAQTNALRRAWMRSVALLGDRWLAIPRPKHAGDAAVVATCAIGALCILAGDAHAAGVIDLDAWLWAALGWGVVFSVAVGVLVVAGDRWLGDEGES